ncbi:MAG TPA: hypothetical protein PKY35_03980 [Candidatus Hydrogenedentes bacterium]|nr:hypothetical protein [Candidatus Hydrogenedentota bacterium]HOL76164.1 hypothetical protein [Candidatus Hydrogenedentota bacterium]HPO84779.1 hypothetical protein [Candidatus Hydrogenedentota bacterium]
MVWFDALVEFVNSIPPCNTIDCFPDFLEDFFRFLFTLIDSILALFLGNVPNP